MDEKKFMIGSVHIRWGFLELDLEQAEKIAEFENKQRFHSLKTIFSKWEKLDYELFVFSEILNKEQTELYVDERKRRIKSLEDDLVETDNSELTQKQMAHEIEEIQYLETEFLPGVLKDFTTSFFMWYPYKTKYDFLKSEYKSYLDEKNREMISTHFRHNRTLQPNTLKKGLLQLKKEGMCPNFSNFKIKMDEPTKAAADMLKNHFKIFDRKKDLVTPQIKALYSFREKASNDFLDYLKNLATPLFISHSEDKRSDEEKETDLYFSLLLIDKDYYGYK